MREIKYRGIDVDSGKLVCGCVDLRGLYDSPSAIIIIGELNSGVWYIKPETVGQFIGVHDCEGKEIYEGDICEVVSLKSKPKCVIKWDFDKLRFAMFSLEGDVLQVQFRENAFKKLKVVGNIYDNAEWLDLKEEAEEDED